MSGVAKLAVVGAGTMGHGIAYVAAAAGCAVALTDADPAVLTRARAQIAGAFTKAIEKGKATAQQRDQALARLTTHETMAAAMSGADLAIEAVPERLDLKRRIFAELESLSRGDTILASNTSSIPISEIASALERPGRAVGLHFFNPVPVMRLVEVVRGVETSDETVRAVREFAESLGKTTIVVRDTPGFATSRLGVVLGLEAIRMLEQGVASAEDIDRAMELGYNHPMGPLRLTDLVGLDVRLSIAETLHAALGDDTYRPPALLREKVRAGQLGRKTGQGFYTWEQER